MLDQFPSAEGIALFEAYDATGLKRSDEPVQFRMVGNHHVVYHAYRGEHLGAVAEGRQAKAGRQYGCQQGGAGRGRLQVVDE
jgi:hypothetical protein